MKTLFFQCGKSSDGNSKRTLCRVDTLHSNLASDNIA